MGNSATSKHGLARTGMWLVHHLWYIHTYECCSGVYSKILIDSAAREFVRFRVFSFTSAFLFATGVLSKQPPGSLPPRNDGALRPDFSALGRTLGRLLCRSQ